MKYELTNKTRVVRDVTLRQIRAVKPFSNIKKGSLGGFVQSLQNLSQQGNCWISRNAIVMGQARIENFARITGYSIVRGQAVVRDHAKVRGCAEVTGQSVIQDRAIICDRVKIFNAPIIGGRSMISGDSMVFDQAIIGENAILSGTSRAGGNVIVRGDGELKGQADARGQAIIEGNMVLSRAAFSFSHSGWEITMVDGAINIKSANFTGGVFSFQEFFSPHFIREPSVRKVIGMVEIRRELLPILKQASESLFDYLPNIGIHAESGLKAV